MEARREGRIVISIFLAISRVVVIATIFVAENVDSPKSQKRLLTDCPFTFFIPFNSGNKPTVKIHNEGQAMLAGARVESLIQPQILGSEFN
jgi:hypothetical protein